MPQTGPREGYGSIGCDPHIVGAIVRYGITLSEKGRMDRLGEGENHAKT